MSLPKPNPYCIRTIDLVLGDTDGTALSGSSGPINKPSKEIQENVNYLYSLYGSSLVNLKDYLPSGYVIDGSVDYTSYIQAAITAGQRIYIPKGIWTISAPLNVRGFRHLFGAGRGNTILRAAVGLTDFVIKSADGSTSDWLPYTTISHLTIDGAGSTNAFGGIYAEFITKWEFEKIEIYGFYKTTAVGLQLDHAYQILHKDCYVRMGSTGAGKKGEACFKVGATTADPVHTTHITFDNCLAQYSGTGFLFDDMSNRGGNMTIRQCAAGNHDYGIRIKDFYREVLIENSLIENTSIRGISATTTSSYNIHNLRLEDLTMYECTTAVFTNNVDGLKMNHLRFVGDDIGGHTAFNLANSKRVELGTYNIEDTAYNTFTAGEDPRFPNLYLNDATPSVAFGARKQTFKTQSTAPTTITMFDDGIIGQEISVIFTDNNTTIDFTGTNLKGNNNQDYLGQVNDRLNCIFDGTYWICTINSANSGEIVQVITYQTGAVNTGATVMPIDDSIPTNTEGTELMSLAITPTSATNKIIIEIEAQLSAASANKIGGALYQDSNVNALAANCIGNTVNGWDGAPMPLTLKHIMTAGTTSPTTFKFRAGPAGATTITFNGSGGVRLFGGVMASSITITEIKA